MTYGKYEEKGIERSLVEGRGDGYWNAGSIEVGELFGFLHLTRAMRRVET
eukprot:CAMPEP_0113909600 /NCGR_PEP_ID=MMETSP0780_2-20120614/26960_1 /TAXON_ID=652834 /ORGANISM="Palpitomonas bilix" /LENGTH=49 /DNA_ID=CAMNT_0000905463 /DNA_START=47 /DNA_END=193 /DNA_ORIENTATION=- /assembly_acc=CAM_ASM_000599